MSEVNISFIRKKPQHYLVTAGAGILGQFPPGPEGRQAAAECALKYDDPEVYAAAHYLAHDLFRFHADLHGRIWRAARLVVAGLVRGPYPIVDDTATLARVQSSHFPDQPDYHYRISRPFYYYCTCFDFQERAAPKIEGQRLCKHILAVKLHNLIGRPLSTWPQPLPGWWNISRRNEEFTTEQAAAVNEHYRQAMIAAGEHIDDADMAEILDVKRKVGRAAQLNQKSRDAGREVTGDRRQARPEASEGATVETPLTEMSLDELNELLVG